MIYDINDEDDGGDHDDDDHNDYDNDVDQEAGVVKVGDQVVEEKKAGAGKEVPKEKKKWKVNKGERDAIAAAAVALYYSLVSCGMHHKNKILFVKKKFRLKSKLP